MSVTIPSKKNLKKKCTRLAECFFRKRISFNRTGNWNTQKLDTIHKEIISKYREEKRTPIELERVWKYSVEGRRQGNSYIKIFVLSNY